MNISFRAPEFLHELGGGTTDILHANYLIPAHDRKTKQQKAQIKPQMNADRTIITS
jgi:hypothetical protein